MKSNGENAGIIKTVKSFMSYNFDLSARVKIETGSVEFYLGTNKNILVSLTLDGNKPGVNVTSKDFQQTVFYNKFTTPGEEDPVLKQGEFVTLGVHIEGSTEMAKLSFTLNGTPLVAKVNNEGKNVAMSNGNGLSVLQYTEISEYTAANVSFAATRVAIGIKKGNVAEIDSVTLTDFATNSVKFSDEFESLSASVWRKDEIADITENGYYFPQNYNGNLKTRNGLLTEKTTLSLTGTTDYGLTLTLGSFATVVLRTNEADLPKATANSLPVKIDRRADGTVSVGTQSLVPWDTDYGKLEMMADVYLNYLAQVFNLPDDGFVRTKLAFGGESAEHDGVMTAEERETVR